MSKRIAVGFIAYPINGYRVDYLTRAIVAAKQCIEASQDELVWFCSVETHGYNAHGNGILDSDADTPQESAAVALCARHDIPVHWHGSPPSMGANENNAMRIAFDQLKCDYLLLHIDDCYAIRNVDLSQAISFLDLNPEVDILRYCYSSRPECKPILTPRNGGVFQVDPASKFFYDDSPHVRRPSFVERFGEHPAGNHRLAGEACAIGDEGQTNATLRRGRQGKFRAGVIANICTYPNEYFEKHGPVSASR